MHRIPLIISALKRARDLLLVILWFLQPQGSLCHLRFRLHPTISNSSVDPKTQALPIVDVKN